MTIDAAGLPLSISSRTAHPNLGDVVMTTTFADYQDVNGFKLPARLTGKVDDFTTWEIKRPGRRSMPTSAISRRPRRWRRSRRRPRRPTSRSQPLGKGVWLLAGQSHHSALSSSPIT